MLGHMTGAAARIWITDDRGRECLLVGPPDPWPRHTWYGRLKVKGDVDGAMLAELKWARTWGGAYGAVGGLSMVFLVGGARWLLGSHAGWPVWIGTFGTPVLAGILMWPLAPVVARHFRVRAAAGLRGAYLGAGRCASCGYDLAGLEREADGCTRCPECGGGWRVEKGRSG